MDANTAHFVENHTSAECNPVASCKKLNEESTSHRVMGPFPKNSPLGLVPKKDGTSPVGNSLNDTIPTEFSTVYYQNLDDAFDLIYVQVVILQSQTFVLLSD